jgi:hypothetical protein
MAPTNQRWWLTTDSVSTEIAASPDQLYAMVSDLPRMAEWSPEQERLEWIEGATGPAVGARFLGHNMTGPGRRIKWKRRGTVRCTDPGRTFSFATEEGGVEGTIWTYAFEPVAGGTRVTESYTVAKIPVWARILDVPLNRHKELLQGMTSTLSRLKASAETNVN